MLIGANPEAAAGWSRTRVPYNEKLAGCNLRFSSLSNDDIELLIHCIHTSILPLIDTNLFFGDSLNHGGTGHPGIKSVAAESDHSNTDCQCT